MGIFSEIFGGGGSDSTVNTNMTSKNAVEVLTKNIMNCANNTMLNQRFVMSGNYNVAKNVRMIQNLKLSSSCAQNVQNLQNIQQSVTSALQASANAQGEALLGAFGNATVSQINSTIANEVSQKITASTIQNIVNTTNAQQEIIISGSNSILDTFEMSQTMDLLQQNCQSALSQLTSVQAIDANANLAAAAKQNNPIAEVINSVFSGLSSLFSLWVILIIVICIAGVAVVYYAGGVSTFIGLFTPN